MLPKKYQLLYPFSPGLKIALWIVAFMCTLIFPIKSITAGKWEIVLQSIQQFAKRSLAWKVIEFQSFLLLFSNSALQYFNYRLSISMQG